MKKVIMLIAGLSALASTASAQQSYFDSSRAKTSGSVSQSIGKGSAPILERSRGVAQAIPGTGGTGGGFNLTGDEIKKKGGKCKTLGLGGYECTLDGVKYLCERMTSKCIKSPLSGSSPRPAYRPAYTFPSQPKYSFSFRRR